MNNWENKTIVVAGGSKGLGLAIAKSFHARGAHVVILARGAETLNEEIQKLNDQRAESATGIQVDLLDESAVRDAVNRAEKIKGGIQVWVNAVGQSTRIEFSKATPEIYQQLMQQNFFAVVNGTCAVLDLLQQSGGHLVNIGSLASRTAWPYVAPYVTSKHALAGFTNQLRLEGPANVHYLLVCPGPIASNSGSTRYEVTEGMSDQASRPGAGAPVKLIDPERLARKIVKACEKRKPELVVPGKSRILFGLLQFWPSVGHALLKRISKNK